MNRAERVRELLAKRLDHGHPSKAEREAFKFIDGLVKHQIKDDWAKAWVPKRIRPKTEAWGCSNCGHEWRRSKEAILPRACARCAYAFPSRKKGKA